MIDVPNIEKRRIQGLIIKPIYEELVAEIGKDRARDLIGRAITRSAVEEARQAAAHEGQGHRSMEGFTRIFDRTYRQRGPASGLEAEVLREDAKHLDFDVTRCQFVEMYRELGLGEIAAVLSCNRDGVFAQAFDGRITLGRAQTIADGADRCTFRYRYDDEEKGG